MRKQDSVRRWKARLNQGRAVTYEEVLDLPNAMYAVQRMGLKADWDSSFRVKP